MERNIYTVAEEVIFTDHVNTLAKRTGFGDPDFTEEAHMRLGLLSELGELITPYKSYLAYGKVLDKENVIEEIGDLLFYLYALDDSTAAHLLFDAEEWDKEENPFALHKMLLGLGTYLSQPIIQKDRVLALLVVLAYGVGVTLADCMKGNIEKLAKRYPDGYSDLAAIKRADKE